MIRIDHVTKAFGGLLVLKDVSVVVNDGETVGVVGPNGSGKSTLLAVAAGRLAADSGLVEAHGQRVGYLRQGYRGEEHRGAAELFPSAYPEVTTRRLEDPARAVAEGRDGAAEAYDALLTRIVAMLPQGAVAEVRRELDVDAVPADAPVGRLSGGELARLGLADLVASQPDALLLDEPTNHLDLRGIRWVERWIEGFAGPALVVSHDRALLDAVADAIVAFDRAGGAAERFAGGYSDYAEERERRRAEQEAAFARQQRRERALKRAISSIESRARDQENKTIHFHYKKRALKVARRAVTLKSRLQREARSEDRIERPEDRLPGLRGGFGAAERSAGRLVEVFDAAITVAGRDLLGGVGFVVERGARLGLVGANGSGKTTLLRSIIGEIAPREGRVTVAASARIGYLPQEDDGSTLPGATPVEVVRRVASVSEAEAYNLLHRFLFGHERAGTALERLSYGERRRLALARLMIEGANLLLLDEPTNHLDLPSRDALESALEGFDGAIVAVSHDRYFLARVVDEVLEIADGRLRRRGVDAYIEAIDGDESGSGV